MYIKCIIINLYLKRQKNKYEQEGNNIMIKSFTCLLDDLFHDDKLYNTINKNNSNSILIYSDDRQKNEKLIMHNKKQMSMAMLPEKRLNEMSREILLLLQTQVKIIKLIKMKRQIQKVISKQKK